MTGDAGHSVRSFTKKSHHLGELGPPRFIPRLRKRRRQAGHNQARRPNRRLQHRPCPCPALLPPTIRRQDKIPSTARVINLRSRGRRIPLRHCATIRGWWRRGQPAPPPGQSALRRSRRFRNGLGCVFVDEPDHQLFPIGSNVGRRLGEPHLFGFLMWRYKVFADPK